MKDKMPDRIWAAPNATHTWLEFAAGSMVDVPNGDAVRHYIATDQLKWRDTRKGELPGADDFPVLIKDDFESAFGDAARIEVVTATHKFGEERWHGLYTSHSHGNYPFWRPIVEVE